MKFVVRVQGEPEEERAVTVEPGEAVTVGRSADCDLELSDAGVSRRHCRLENSGRALRAVDLDSTNGTWLEGEPVDEAEVEPGQEISVGPVPLECRAAPGREARAPGRTREAGGATRMRWRESDSDTVYRSKVDTEAPWPAAEDVPGEDELEELRRARRHFGTAYEVSRMLARQPDREALPQSVLDAVFGAIEADRAALLLGPEDEGEEGPEPETLRVVAARDREGPLSDGDEEIEVSRTVVADVLENGVSTLSRDATEDPRFQEAKSVIAQDIRSVVCSPVATDERKLGVLYADNQGAASAFTETEVELLALIGHQAGLAIHRARLAAELEEFFFDTIRAIVATIDAKDGYTHRHSERVSAFALRIAGEAGVEEEDRLEAVRLSGLLHDIGKIGVPDAVLNKEGELTDEEYAQVKKHPSHGERILSHLQNPRFEAVLPGVRYHHERWDGTGYPEGLSGEDIPFLGRVLAVADVLDALSSDRSYRDAHSLDRAVETVGEDAGSHFDPELAAAAERLHERGELEVARREVGAPSASPSRRPGR